MAETKTENKSTPGSTGQQGLSRQSSVPARRNESMRGGTSNPFELMDRMTDEVDRWFDNITRSMGFPRFLDRRPLVPARGREGMWWPRIETGQEGDRFLVRADLPGLKKNDIDVNIMEDAITIRGQRTAERQEDHAGVWHSEREYGEFQRTIPLPEGIIAESAKATFRDGVLEISVQAAPSEANRGRKIEIQEGEAEENK